RTSSTTCPSQRDPATSSVPARSSTNCRERPCRGSSHSGGCRRDDPRDGAAPERFAVPPWVDRRKYQKPPSSDTWTVAARRALPGGVRHLRSSPSIAGAYFAKRGTVRCRYEPEAEDAAGTQVRGGARVYADLVGASG